MLSPFNIVSSFVSPLDILVCKRIQTKHIYISETEPETQAKASLEKAKQALEKEAVDLNGNLRSLGNAKQDVEQKKKKVETQLADLQTRFNESERKREELGDAVSKLTVRYMFRHIL